jgi:hypothetical protein
MLLITVDVSWRAFVSTALKLCSRIESEGVNESGFYQFLVEPDNEELLRTILEDVFNEFTIEPVTEDEAIVM